MEPYASRIEAVLARRAEAGRYAPGLAAYSDSDMFKKPPYTDTKGLPRDKPPGTPVAKRWDSHFSAESRARRPCVLKQAAKYLKTPGLISLGGGLPSASYFPFDSLSVSVPPRPDFNLPHTSPPDKPAPPSTLSIGKYDMAEGADYDLSVALNYSQVTGAGQMLRFVTELTEILYAPLYADWWCMQTTGSTGALETVARMFCDKARGDSILMEEYTFSTAQETMEALGIRVVGVKMDGEGIVPAELKKVLDGWDEAARGRKPHVLYTVPTGQNPTGASLSEGRRREIYAICEEHDIFIVEDDPYYLLQMPAYPRPGGDPSADADARLSSYMASLPGTFLSIDTSGRVLRLDSFSKILSPGSRLGWATGSAQVIERFLRQCESSQGPSGFSQAALHTLLERAWGGHRGFLEWVAALGVEYEARRNVLLRACDDFLPEVARWDVPRAGMFLWIKLDHTKHPRFSSGVPALEEEIFQSCISKGVLVARGSWFRAAASDPHHHTVNGTNGCDPDAAAAAAVNGYHHGEEDEPSELFFRTTFAAATVEGMREAMRRFGEAIRESFEIHAPAAAGVGANEEEGK